MPQRNPDASEPNESAVFYHEMAAGWPMLALRCSQTVTVTKSSTVTADRWSFKRPKWLAKYCKSLEAPLCPIWLGLIANTLAFGAAWYGLLFGIGTYRLVRRRAHGSCPQCGYDLRNNPHAGCPECGWMRDGGANAKVTSARRRA